MKQRFLVLVVLLTLSACAALQEIIQPTNTPAPSTATAAPTQTPLPSPTPTPLPYYPEEGILYDQDDLTGDYIIVAEEIDALTTTAEGEIAALDGSGYPRFVFNGDIWEESKVDPNYGYIAPEVHREESLPLIKEWWEGYKEKASARRTLIVMNS